MLISSVYKSLQRNVVEIIDEIKTQTGNQAVSYWSWESHADEAELPKETLVGVGDFDFTENHGLWVIRYSIGLSPFNDRNLDQQLTMLDIIHNFTGERCKVNLLDPQTGEFVSELVVSAFHVAPAASTELRTYRTVSIELLRTDSATV